MHNMSMQGDKNSNMLTKLVSVKSKLALNPAKNVKQSEKSVVVKGRAGKMVPIRNQKNAKTRNALKRPSIANSLYQHPADYVVTSGTVGTLGKDESRPGLMLSDVREPTIEESQSPEVNVKSSQRTSFGLKKPISLSNKTQTLIGSVNVAYSHFKMSKDLACVQSSDYTHSLRNSKERIRIVDNYHQSTQYPLITLQGTKQ